MCVPESVSRVDLFRSVLSANIQGVNRSAQILVSKWDSILHLTEKGQGTVVLVQETWGSESAQGKRSIMGFWCSRSARQEVGKGLEIWCQGACAQKLAVLSDSQFALLVVVRNVRGVGIIGSVHMAQRSEGSKFEAQMSIISSIVSATPHEWLLIGGDWNRDIRTHGVAQSFIFRLGAWVSFVKNKVHLPKDFVILKGLTGQSTGSWLSPIGDHPVVWIKGVSSAQAGSTRSANHPVEPGKWSPAQKQMFPS